MGLKSPNVLMSSFQCRADGKSEGYSAYCLMEQVSRFSDLTLLTVDETSVPAAVEYVKPSNRFNFGRGILNRINGEFKLDYFWFDYQSRRRFSDGIDQFDLVHHVAPIAPRYPCSLGTIAKKFIIGPVGGCQRVPEAFRAEVEGGEPFYFKFRSLDQMRLQYDPVLRGTFDAADLVILVGRFMYDIIPEQYHGKCKVMLETGIVADAFSPTPNVSKGEFIELLYVGRVVPYKGLIYFLQALARLPKAVRERFRLRVVGDSGEGGYEQECKDFVASRGLSDAVKFLGLKKKEEVLNLYGECDLFAFPSLAETSGNVVLEAMAVGRPALVANCGGPSEIVDESGGYLVDPKAPDSFVDGLKDVLLRVVQHPDELMEKGRGARRIIEEKFDWKRKGEVLRKWYDEVISTNRWARGSS